MAKKRTKTTVITNVTEKEANKAFAEFAKASANITQINAGLDEEMTALREAKADELAVLAAEKDKAFATVQAYATENKDVLFAKRKSVETPHGTFGYRTGTPKLKTLKGFTWAAVASVLGELAPEYTRGKVEADKEKLLADRDNEGMMDSMISYGIEVVQDETFYIDAKTEETPA